MEKGTKESKAGGKESRLKKKFFWLSLKEDGKLREIAYRLNVTQVDWLRRKIDEEHAGLGR